MYINSFNLRTQHPTTRAVSYRMCGRIIGIYCVTCSFFILQFIYYNGLAPFEGMPSARSIHDQHAMHLVALALFSDVSNCFQILAKNAVRNSVISAVINEVRHTYVIFY